MIQITSYSDFYYQTIEGQPPPPRTAGKFVLILQTDGPLHAVFSPIELSVYHANIVERFLNQRHISGHYNAPKDKYFIDDPSWQIAGGGYWELDTNESLLQLRGASLAYGRAHASHLKMLMIAAKKHFGVRVVCDE